MSASITVHTASRDLMAVIDWGCEMIFRGYEVRPLRLPNGVSTVTAYPKETARTNAHVAKMSRYCGQFGKSNPNLTPAA